MADLRECSCVNEADFFRQIEELKSQLKTKDSRITCYVKGDFYDKAKNFLKQKGQRQLGVSRDDNRSEPKEELTKWKQQTILERNGYAATTNSSQKRKRKLFQNGHCFKSCPMHTVEFPTEEG